MSLVSLLGGIIGGPLKDLTETRKATKAAKLDMAIKMVEAKAKLELAKLEAASIIAVKQADNTANWEQEAVRQAATSWKDEYWTLIVSIPLVLAFIPSLADEVLRGFETLEQMPIWYQAAVMAALSFAFGLRALNKFTNWNKKGG